MGTVAASNLNCILSFRGYFVYFFVLHLFSYLSEKTGMGIKDSLSKSTLARLHMPLTTQQVALGLMW